MTLIEPRTLRGFRDYLPEVMIPRERCMEIARQVFRRFGFVPIDTPALELLEVLTGKGSEETDRQLYHFEDAGGRQVGLRFDLTVPLARFAAQHIGQLGTPFKRYHLATVWRGESPQAGRYREFMQCDFDTIGTESVLADIETLLVIHDLFQALDITDFTVHVNNRQVLNGLLQEFGVADRAAAVLRSLDKLSKIGEEGVAKELHEGAGLRDDQGQRVLQLANVRGEPAEVLSQVRQLAGANELVKSGADRLESLLAGAAASGIPAKNIRLDISIARGLDYYTGVVFETFLDQLPSIGSVCSGGRYDNLAGMFTKQHLPGVGASLGLDRLLAALEQLNRMPNQKTTAQVFVAYFEEARRDDYLRLIAAIRAAGVSAELFPEPKKLGQQLKYADSRGFAIALIAGSNEFAAGRIQIKELKTKTSLEVAWTPDNSSDLLNALRERL